jgi:hypothetical protein
MSRRRATFTQADVSRAIRAAKREGAAAVEVRPSGSIVIRLLPADGDDAGMPVEGGKEVIL